MTRLAQQIKRGADQAWGVFVRRLVLALARIFHAAPLYGQICVDFGAGQG
jgi:hypothetical protein